MKRSLVFLLAMMMCIPCLPGETALPRGHVFFQANFEGADALKQWTGAQLQPGYQGGQALFVERDTPGASMATVRLPVEQMRGYTVYGFAMVKAENVSQPPQPWNGIKFMAPIDAPSGRQWPQAGVGVGSFDWKKVSFSVRVPPDATAMSLNLGLESVSGKVWFDDVRIVVGKPPFTPPSTPPAGPAFRGCDLPRLRGAMISPSINEDGLRTLGQEWNANLIRWQLIRSGAAARIATAAEYDAWLERELTRLDAMLPICKKYGLYVVLDLHSPFGGKPTTSGYVGSDSSLFTSKTCQAQFVEGWKRMAARYKDSKIIWGYDLVNEPVEGAVEEDCDDWHDLAERAAKAIRTVDMTHAIIVEPNNWGGPEAMAGFRPIAVPNVVYSAHMYVPGHFTHQSVFDKQQKEVRYPGIIDGKNWDKAALEKALSPVAEFQKTYNVAIYIGEFSAIRWAPDQSAYRYLKDVIDIYESHGWDWSYHAFREWSGWSVEHTEDRNNSNPAAQPTERQKLLMEWYSKNQKPKW
ncbi:MAG: cellulase family glycosylhydrolase [Candidatus Sumerlaeota bacterium]|nr:cellulase family glycosylhydrolase [Candidatus Sumerlaeota bacterium]